MIYFFCGLSILCTIGGMLADSRRLINAGMALAVAAPMLGLAAESIIKMIIP